MFLLKPDYNRSILSLMGSMTRRHGLPFDSSLQEVDELLQDDRPVLMLLMDGLSLAALNRLPEGSFLREHLFTTLHSVFPTTTTAATTSLMSGLYPQEHAWLGWNLYFKELEAQAVTVFLDETMNEKVALEKNFAKRRLAYETVFSRLEKQGVSVEVFSPFDGTYYHDLEDLFRRLEGAIKERQFIYAYHTEPDYLTHHVGTDSVELESWMIQFNHLVERYRHLADEAHFFILADHGHINSEAIFLEDYPELYQLLRQSPSMEMRASAIFVKEGMHEDFERIFKENFSDFLLLSQQEVLEAGLLGRGEIHPRVFDFLGDYLAIATGGRHLEEKRSYASGLISQHAGLTKEELMVPLIYLTDN